METSASKAEFVIGVDLGGTKIMAGLFNRQMECLSHSKVRTKAQKGQELVKERIVRCIREAAEKGQVGLDQVRAIGIGAPGPVDSETGRVVFAPNLGWRDLNLKQELESILHVPVFVENDCNVCTLGIQAVELRGNPRHMIGIFLGTGIGSGLILNGQLFNGFNRTAGEIGHMVLDVNGPECGCGKKGCFEALASRTAIFKRLQAAVESGQESLLTQMLGKDLRRMRSSHLRKAVARGDSLVDQVVRQAAHFAGIAVANVVNLLSPEFVVLGGGLIEQLEDIMMTIIADTASHYAMPGTMKEVSIQASRLADDAGIVGASVLALRRTT